MPAVERLAVIENLRMVDHCILFNDDDGSSIEAIRNVQMLYPKDEIIFANGGDRTAVNIPEMVVQDVVFKFGVGGDDKQNSSSWILEEWKKPRTDRAWGSIVCCTKLTIMSNSKNSQSCRDNDLVCNDMQIVQSSGLWPKAKPQSIP